MLVFGILFLFVVLIGLRGLIVSLGRLVLDLLALALPLFVGFSAGMALYHHGAGVAGALLFAILAAGAMVALGQIAFNTARSAAVRGAVGLVYAVPAAMAGHYLALSLAQIVIASPEWCEALALAGAVAAGAACILSMARLAPPLAETGAQAHHPHAGLAATTQG